jgi:plasmid rolling circle replication initiator protein Rep
MIKSKCQGDFLVDDVNGVRSVVEYHKDGDLQTIVTHPILVDKNSMGKERPWRYKKVNNVITSDVYKSISEFDGDYWDKKAQRLLDCSTFLRFNVLDEHTHHLKLRSMNSCRVRLCPVCAWRRTLKVSSHARKIFTYLEEFFPNKYSYLLLTLTVPNCPADALSDEITHLMKSFDRLFKRKEVKSVVCGWYRGLEVTHNHVIGSNSYNTYHPHFHVLLVVDKSYTVQHCSSVGYISHERWLNLWRESCRDDNITQVDIRTVKPKRVNSNSDDVLSSNGVINAICEVTKYTVKDSDYVIPYDWDLSQDIVKTLDTALANRRLVAWGGILKEIHNKLNLDDEVDGDLVNIDEDVADDDTKLGQLLAFWHTGYQQYIVYPFG